MAQQTRVTRNYTSHINLFNLNLDSTDFTRIKMPRFLGAFFIDSGGADQARTRSRQRDWQKESYFLPVT